jgi:hypothetical protein
MTHIVFISGMYGSKSALFSQLYTSFGYRMHGTIDYHALSTTKAGYGEPKQVVDINERILTDNNSRWFDIQPISQLTSWHISDESNHQIHTYIDSLSHNVIIDDPRLSYTLPFWQKRVTAAGHTSTVVVPYQHPLLFAHRMHNQHHMSTRLALALWVAYTLAVEIQSRSCQRIFVHHDAMMSNWQDACKPLIDQIATDGLPHTVVAQINAYIHMLRHTKPTEPTISTPVRQLAITQLAEDVYTAIQKPNIDPTVIAILQQRLLDEIADPQYRHDVGQYDVIYHDIFLDTEARIARIHMELNDEIRRQTEARIRMELNDEIHRQHSDFSKKMRLLHEEHSKKMTEVYEQHSRYIERQNQLFTNTITKHEQQLAHMRATFEQEIHHLNDKIATMQTEIDWRTDVSHRQQHTLNKLGWAIRIMTITDRIARLWRKS